LIESNSTIFQLATKKTLSITECKKNGVKGRKNEKKKETKRERRREKKKKKEINLFYIACLSLLN
jgi:hypothetical protein